MQLIMSKKIKVTILGAGNMGTALAKVIGDNGFTVRLWNYEGDPEPLQQIAASRENKKYLPGVVLGKKVIPTPDLSAALAGAEVVFTVLPSAVIDATLERARPFLAQEAIIADVSKGFSFAELIHPDEAMAALKKQSKKWHRMVVLSGPAIAIDMARGGFTAMNIASADLSAVQKVSSVLENDFLRLVPTRDVVGIKLGGALKNIYAILFGLCDGLEMEMNTKSFLLTKVLAEMQVVLRFFGARGETVYGLAGLGDVVGTGLCVTSRNRRFGEYLAVLGDRSVAEEKVGQVVEGVRALKIVYQFIRHKKMVLPIANMLYGVVWKKTAPAPALKKLLHKI